MRPTISHDLRNSRESPILRVYEMFSYLWIWLKYVSVTLGYADIIKFIKHLLSILLAYSLLIISQWPPFLEPT